MKELGIPIGIPIGIGALHEDVFNKSYSTVFSLGGYFIFICYLFHYFILNWYYQYSAML